MLHAVGRPFRCSNCNNSLVFKTEENNCIICPACQAINYRLVLPDKTAPFAEKVKEEMSILRVGTSGTLSGKTFEVIGRLQYFFQDSYRNHWQLHFSDNTVGWLGDWAGNFCFFLEVNARHTNRFINAAPGKKIELMDTPYELEMMDEHRLTFGEGEVLESKLAERGFITLFLNHVTKGMGLVNIFKKEPENAAAKAANRLQAFTGHYLEAETLNLQNTRNYDDWR